MSTRNLTGLVRMSATFIGLVDPLTGEETDIRTLFQQVGGISATAPLSVTQSGNALTISANIGINDVSGLTAALANAGMNFNISGTTYSPTQAVLTGNVIGTPSTSGSVLTIPLSYTPPSVAVAVYTGAGANLIANTGLGAVTTPYTIYIVCV